MTINMRRSPEMASAPRCHLLALPPELRIQIYEYFFGEETWVYVTDPIPHDPAIMRTCRQIRTEAVDTYRKYIDHIVFKVIDCDVARVVLWHARAAHHCSGFMWLMMGNEYSQISWSGWDNITRANVRGFRRAAQTSCREGVIRL